MLNSFLATDEQEQESKQENWWPLAKAEFDALREEHSRHPHKEKMVNTIFYLVDARVSGKPETAVFVRPDVCSENTYYAKWRKDAAFAACLENVTRLALEWKDGRYARALKTAVERLQLASPNAAAKMVVLMGDRDPNVVFRAAKAILDMTVGENTSKDAQLMNTIMGMLDLSQLTNEQIGALQEAKSVADILKALVG